jgi:hypothetical protein
VSDALIDKPARPKHPLAGRTVKVRSPRSSLHDAPFRVVDWWDRVSGLSWRDAPNKIAAHYDARRRLLNRDLPDDDEVVIGRIDSAAYLVHQSELGEVLS